MSQFMISIDEKSPAIGYKATNGRFAVKEDIKAKEASELTKLMIEKNGPGMKTGRSVTWTEPENIPGKLQRHLELLIAECFQEDEEDSELLQSHRPEIKDGKVDGLYVP